MKKIFIVALLGYFAIASFAQVGATREETNATSNVADENSLVMEKKQKAIKSLFYASAGLNNVIVDFYKEAIRAISSSPDDTTYIIFQPDSHAPDQYIKIVENEVFQSDIWKFMENRMIEQGGKTFYEDIMNAYDNTGLISVVGSLPSKEQWMKRFILPNLRAVYVNQLYWETFGPRIEKEDMPLIVDALESYVKK